MNPMEMIHTKEVQSNGQLVQNKGVEQSIGFGIRTQEVRSDEQLRTERSTCDGNRT